MKQHTILKQILFITSLTVFFFASLQSAFAATTPTLSLSATGNGDSVNVSVTGDSSSSVILYYTPTNSTLQVKAIGNTNSSGNFSTVISSSSYGLTTDNPVYVSTGGVNGLVSQTLLWPTVTASAANPITLDKTGLVLTKGTTGSIAVTNNTSGSLYVYNNSNSTVASAAINGNQVTILALGYGSSAITICAVGYTTNCPVATVTVQNSTGQTLSFSQNNISLTYGQSTAVTISGGTGSYIISNNSSSGNVSASISNNVIVLGGNSATSGTHSITICSSDMSSCGVVNVILGTTSSNSVSFSQSSPTLTVGQSMTVSVYGNTSTTYYISSNSNASVLQSSISNNILNLYGVSSGTAILNVCANSGGCSSLTVTVSSTSTTGSVNLSQSSLSLPVGKTSSVAISGGTTPYVLLTTSNSIFQAGISGSSLFVTGAEVGSAQIIVCSSTKSGCSTLSLQVTGTQTTTDSSIGTSFLSFGTDNPSLNIGQSSTVIVSGGINTAYTLTYNSNASALQASISGNTLSLYGLKNGHAILVVCDSMSNCGALHVVVGSTNTYTNNTNTSGSALPPGCTSGAGYSAITGAKCGTGTTAASITTTTKTTANYIFTKFLNVGDDEDEVYKLQQRLTDLGHYSGPITGYFGPLTASGVKSLQRTHNISPVGYVGPATRAALNAY